MKQYHDLLQHVLDTGDRREDRTGTGTISSFGHMLRFDLQEGFPLITTKNMFWRGVVGELLWFISGSTNANELEEKYGVKFWREWADPDGSLGPVYGEQLRNIRTSAWVTPKRYTPEPAVIPTFDKTVEVENGGVGKTAMLGVTVDTLRSGRATAIKEVVRPGKRTRLIVKFHDTGFEREVTYGDVQKGMLWDPYSPTVFGVGMYGEYDEDDEFNPLLKDTWRDMIRRCYYEGCKHYRSYGGKGVHVSPEWLIYANFQRDVKKIPSWVQKVVYPDQYSLDKDILYASNRYSKETCIWAKKEEQALNTSTNLPFTAVSPEGKTHLFPSIGDANRRFGLNLSAVHRCLFGKLHKHHKWTKFQHINNEDKVLRTRVFDQLAEVIANIKVDPTSRRHVISLWNRHDIDKMNLPPCHGNIIQFYVEDGKLSCMMYQRSADIFLGLPVNIASYALLTHMIAQITQLDVGELIISLGDAHLYADHVEQAKLQLTREPYPLPQLRIKRKVTDIDDFKYEDFEVVGYQAHPHIKARVSV